jgi:hypothetical protein
MTIQIPMPIQFSIGFRYGGVDGSGTAGNVPPSGLSIQSDAGPVPYPVPAAWKYGLTTGALRTYGRERRNV